MRTFLLAVASFTLVSCSIAESDRSSFDPLAMARTRIDYNPIPRPEREKLIEYEKIVLAQKTEPFRQELAQVSAARAKRYEEIKDQFPNCEKQKHCLSTLVRGKEKDFERYNQLSRSLQEFDRQTIEIEAKIRAWESRYELRTRAIHNRFLVHQITQIPKVDPRIAHVAVHSLEAFDSRRAVSDRLLRLADFDTVATTWGDLNFRMLGRPVDEAVTVAAFDVWLAKPEGKALRHGDRFVVVFLVNSFQADALAYDTAFLKFWGQLFVEDQQKAFRERAACALYSIAGDTLAPKLAAIKADVCVKARAKMQARATRYDAEDWLLPISYFKVQAGE